MVAQEVLQNAWSGSEGPPLWETVLGDGEVLQHRRGVAGDHRISYGSARFHISANASEVLCATDEPLDPAWQRQLLDTVLFSVSFLRGFELLHASAVRSEAGVLAFVARTGGGKSSLAAELVRRGAQLFTDDVLAIGRGPHGPLCFPGPPLMNLPLGSVRPDELGANVIARFPQESEQWVVLPGSASSPQPLAVVHVLEHASGESSLSEASAPTVLDLLPHSIRLPADSQRERGRFQLLGALAEGIAVRRLRVGRDGDPVRLADLVENSLGRTGDQLLTAAR